MVAEMSMNQDVYENLNQARQKLFDMQTSHNMKLVDASFRLELDVVAMAVDDGMEELERLAAQIRLMRK